MLFLLFELARERYAIDASKVVEVLPLLRIRSVPHPPAGVAGLITYRGASLPVVDLSEVMMGRPATPSLTTRLIVVQYPDAHGQTRALGLIAEQVTDTLRRDASEFVPSSIGDGRTACSALVSTDERGIVQWIDVNALLPASLKETLFQDA